MTQDQIASAVSILTALGLGAKAAGIVSIIALAVTVTTGVSAFALPWLPVPSSTSNKVYAQAYGVISRLAGSWRNAAPVPSVAIKPDAAPTLAGGIVPVPPVLKQ